MRSLLRLYLIAIVSCISVCCGIHAGFTADSYVATPDGDVSIEQLEKYDHVYAYDADGNWHICALIDNRSYDVDTIIRIRVDDIDIYATCQQPFYLPQENCWIPAADLAPGHELLSGYDTYVCVHDVEHISKASHVYAPMLGNVHTYCVGPHHIVVHNFQFTVPICTYYFGGSLVMFPGVGVATLGAIAVAAGAYGAYKVIKGSGKSVEVNGSVDLGSNNNQPVPISTPETPQPVTPCSGEHEHVALPNSCPSSNDMPVYGNHCNLAWHSNTQEQHSCAPHTEDVCEPRMRTEQDAHELYDHLVAVYEEKHGTCDNTSIIEDDTLDDSDHDRGAIRDERKGTSKRKKNKHERNTTQAVSASGGGDGGDPRGPRNRNDNGQFPHDPCPDQRDYGAQAPGKPLEADGFVPPKNWDGKKVKHPVTGQYGWRDIKGNIWVPTGPGQLAHGGAHWDVVDVAGDSINVLPGGRIR